MGTYCIPIMVRVTGIVILKNTVTISVLMNEEVKQGGW